MSNIYVSSASWTAVAAWGALTAYSSSSNGGRGDYVRQLASPSVGNERVWRCTTSGTSLASEPSWTLTKNSTTTEVAGPVWTECTGQEADQVTGTWKAPHARLATAYSWGAAGDNWKVGNDHAESQSAAMTLICPGTRSNPCTTMCVAVATGSVPPVAADVLTTPTASITTGDASLGVRGSGLWTGIAFIAGNGSSSARNINLADNTTSPEQKFQNCSARLASSAASTINLGGSSSNGWVLWDNVTYQVGHAGCLIAPGSSFFKWINTPSAIVGATIPTNLLDGNQTKQNIIEGVDLSAMGSGKTLQAAQQTSNDTYFKDCKLGASVTVAATPSVHGANVYLLRSDSGATGYRNEKSNYQGAQVVETTIIRTGGAADQTTGVSWNLSSTANCKWAFPFETISEVNNTVTAADVTVTMYGLYNAAALPNNDDIWFSTEYLGSASTPLGSFAHGSKANFLASGAAQMADTSAWDSLVAARQSAQAYSLGNSFSLASNPGRVFFCTTAGATSVSEPGGYSSAVDGGSVTDGSAVFRAGMRWKQAVTLSSPQPGMAGPIYCYPKVGKASIAAGNLFLDPKPVLS